MNGYDGRFWSSSPGIASHANQTKQPNQTNIMLFPHQEANKNLCIPGTIFFSHTNPNLMHQKREIPNISKNILGSPFQKAMVLIESFFSCCISSRPRGGRLLRVNVKDHFFEKTSEDSEKSSKVALQKFAASSLLKRGF